MTEWDGGPPLEGRLDVLPARTREDRICRTKGCQKQVYARGWCKSHYEKAFRRGEFEPYDYRPERQGVPIVLVVRPVLAPLKPPDPCPSCGGPEICATCSVHHNRHPCGHPPAVEKTCLAPNCSQRVYARSLCQQHYMQIYRSIRMDSLGPTVPAERRVKLPVVSVSRFTHNVLWILAHRSGRPVEEVAAEALSDWAALHRPGGDLGRVDKP